MITGGVSKHVLYDFVKSLGEADCHMALVTDKAAYDPMSDVFTGQGEVRATGYAAGGKKLNNFACGLDDGVAWCAWSNMEWFNATIRAHGAVIYAKKWGNRVVAVLDFGSEQNSSQGLFRVKMPPAGSNGAIFWIG